MDQWKVEAKKKAMRFLNVALANGARPEAEIISDAAAMCISKGTLKHTLDGGKTVVRERCGGAWLWRLV